MMTYSILSLADAHPVAAVVLALGIAFIIAIAVSANLSERLDRKYGDR